MSRRRVGLRFRETQLFELQPISDAEPALQNAPMIRSAQMLLRHLVEHEAIGLTRSKAFQRKFVHWAVEEFRWPGLEAEDLFAVSKVINKYDFLPLETLHFTLLRLKIIRHYKLTCRLTRHGASLAERPGALFDLIAPYFLFHIDHGAYSRLAGRLTGNWEIFLGMLNIEAARGVTCGALRQILYGPPDPDELFDQASALILAQVLRPLCWMGLLEEFKLHQTQPFVDRRYMITPLWARAFKFPFGPEGRSTLRH